jgi:O-antigen/teichoic acid export membrane protein
MLIRRRGGVPDARRTAVNDQVTVSAGGRGRDRDPDEPEDAGPEDAGVRDEADAAGAARGDEVKDPEDTSLAPIQKAHMRGSALLVFGRGFALIIGVATQVLIVRALTKEDFGAFAYALALAGAGRILLSLGQGKLLSRFMATYEEERDYPRMFGAMFLAVGTILVTSTLTIGALYLFSQSLIGSSLEGEDAIRLVLILVFLAPLEALDQIFVSLFAVFSKPRAIFFRKYLMAPGLRLVVVLALVLLDASVFFLAVGYVLAALVGLLLYVGLLVGALRERGLLQEFRPREIIIPYRAVFEFSIPLITGELALLSMTMGGTVVLSLYHSAVEVANYRVVFSSARLNTAITASFSTLFLPVVARLFARGDGDGLRRSYWHTAAFVAVFTFPIFAMTGPLAPATTVTLFGQRYAESAAVLSILSIGYYTNVMLGFNAYTLQVCGRIRYLVGVNITTVVVNIGLAFALAPSFGAVGVATANCVALVTQNLLNQWALRGSISTAFIDRECRFAYAAILGGAAALWGFDLAFSPGIVVSVAAASLVSLLVLLAAKRTLRLGDTFPELLRLPVVGKLLR